MQRVNEAFIGTTEAAEILNVKKSNVRNMLVRYGVTGSLVSQGKRKVHIYPRNEVEQVQKMRLTRKRKRRDDVVKPS